VMGRTEPQLQTQAIAVDAEPTRYAAILLRLDGGFFWRRISDGSGALGRHPRTAGSFGRGVRLRHIAGTLVRQTGFAAGSDVRLGRGRGDVQVNPCIATDSTLLGKSWGR